MQAYQIVTYCLVGVLYAKTSLLHVHVCTLKWKVFDNLAITFLYLKVRETTNKIIKIVSRYLASLMNAHITVRTKSLHCMMNSPSFPIT